VALVSSASVDRHREVVEPEAYKKWLKTYKAHPVLLSSHNYDNLQNVIGEAESVKITEEGLICEFKYYVGQGNPEADWAFQLAKNNMCAFSVGFLAHGYERIEMKESDWSDPKKAMLKYTEVELIEVSQVSIPANRDAVQDRKSEIEGIVKEGKTISDLAQVEYQLCSKALNAKIEAVGGRGVAVGSLLVRLRRALQPASA
jgi:HK97 family phage prohead protease